MDAQTDFSSGRFEACASKDANEQFFDRHAGVPASSLLMPEETRVGLQRRAGLLASLKIGTKRRDDTRREWQSTRFEKLRLPDFENPVVEMDVAEGQTGEFAQSESCTDSEDDHGVLTGRNSARGDGKVRAAS